MKKTFRATYSENGNQVTVQIQGQELDVTPTGTAIFDYEEGVCNTQKIIAFFPSNVIIYEVKTD